MSRSWKAPNTPYAVGDAVTVGKNPRPGSIESITGDRVAVHFRTEFYTGARLTRVAESRRNTRLANIKHVAPAWLRHQDGTYFCPCRNTPVAAPGDWCDDCQRRGAYVTAEGEDGGDDRGGERDEEHCRSESAFATGSGGPMPW